ncbi:MAG: SEL1-like repeat protein [Ectothiorhodospiraceae bacterium]|nr:SEL1-like repeat protein [Ectothiorhodospiraceae bacterium]
MPVVALVVAVLVAVALASSPVPARAQPLAEAELARLARLADGGDARAAYALGRHFEGLPTAADPRAGLESMRWYRRAAEIGLAEARHKVGMLLLDGGTVRPNPGEAAYWFELAAEQGLAEAQYNLGLLYASGTGVARDLTTAARWFRAAANQGLAPAQHELGRLYLVGAGVTLEPRTAAAWFARAASQGNVEATNDLAILLELGVGAPRDPEGARTLYRRAAEAGHPTAGERLAALEAAMAAQPSLQPSQVERATPTPTPTPAPVMPPTPAVAMPAGAVAWVRALDPSRYTIQVYSNADEGAVRSFVEQNIPPGEGGYYRWDRDGVPWFSALLGDFATRAEATAAVARLPDALAAHQPWIRPVRLVHERMGLRR